MSELLLAEGDRLARLLAQKLPVTLDHETRTALIGRSLAVNLINALLPTIEQISRRAGTPLHALLEADARGRAIIEIISGDGELLRRLPVDDVLNELLFRQGRLHPTVLGHLQDALSGDEHHATRALASCLRSRPVLDAMQKLLTGLLKTVR
ncbi:hypothetical protein [Deinococcus sp.]|uniref:hypothetical protein n=1 Tax=Deinococcus sp. TaxID=47478 RepID=UPI0025C65218|nr:hypothetical protein [Deinococcus sp.]